MHYVNLPPSADFFLSREKVGLLFSPSPSREKGGHTMEIETDEPLSSEGTDDNEQGKLTAVSSESEVNNVPEGLADSLGGAISEANWGDPIRSICLTNIQTIQNRRNITMINFD